MVVRWIGCVLAAGLGCTVPNPWFQVSEQASTGEPSTSTTLDTTSTSGAVDPSADPGGAATDATSTSSESATLGAMSSESGDPASTSDTDPNTSEPGTGTTGDALCHDVCGTADCGECPDAPMAAFDLFSIDAREVSNAQYDKFLAAQVDPAEQGPACAWNDSFTPTQWPAGDGALPVVNVDWCDAKAYCRWAGKRLCGAIGGGPTPLPQAFKPDIDQWHHACTDGGKLGFPYGPVYEPKACNVHDYDPNKDAIMPGGALASCMAPLDGLYDLSGNVWELTDTCTGDGPDDTCIRRGGSYFSEPQDLGCYIQSVRPRKDAYAYVGFRCCST